MMSFSRWMRKRAGQQVMRATTPLVEQIQARRRTLAGVPDEHLRLEDSRAGAFAAICEAAWRVLKVEPFDVQIAAGLAIHEGHIAEMQTGEGKTLAAVFPACLHAAAGGSVHILTVNDYLAKRDARWMGGIYRMLGFTVAHLGQETDGAARKAAYQADIVYATANEIGFDLLRDHLRPSKTELVQRPFSFAIIDEADSILIDEARIPLVIAGGSAVPDSLAVRMSLLARQLVLHQDYTKDEFARNVNLTERGARHAEARLGWGSLYDPENLSALAVLNHAIHAKELLKRDVDYVVKNGAVEVVDEFKGRIAANRRWPDGLHAAIEAKEGLSMRREGRVLASITLQNLVDLYPKVAGMTATASTQADEFRRIYDLDVVIIPPNRPNVRRDYADVIFTHRSAKEAALISEIRVVHGTGRPILVGTGSVAESERLGQALELAGIPNQILNARNDEREAVIIAQAGALGAVTISTNMAGRGADILLGGNPPQHREQVAALGGLYVIGTNKHESRRIDNQLRGRAGRQGDPGSSMFFISLEDDLIQRFGVMDLLPPAYRGLRSDDPVEDPEVEVEVNRAQRIIESQNLEIRQRLWKYEGILEQQRRIVHDKRRRVLLGEADGILAEAAPERWDEVVKRFGLEIARDVERRITLGKIDEGWSDYLLRMTEVREGIHWVSLAGHDPVHEFRKSAADIFDGWLAQLDAAVVDAFISAEITDTGVDLSSAGLPDTSSTWTYLINDQPMGDLAQRFFRGMAASWAQLRRKNGKRAGGVR